MWQKGQSGNPKGRPALKPISDMYRKLLVQNPEKLERFCMKQIEMACEGDTNAIKEITDRVEGKPLQSVDVSDHRQSDAADRIREFAAGLSARVSEDSGRRSVQ